MSSLSPAFPASSTNTFVVETAHVCVRHPGLSGERGCTSCSNALCTACHRSRAHSRCPTCREQAGEAATVVDVTWRATLLLDSLLLSLSGVWQRAPALIAILAAALVGPVAVFADDPPSSTSPELQLATLVAAFVGFALVLGAMVQPLLVLPTVARAHLGRWLGGSALALFVMWAPCIVAVVAGAVVDDAIGLDSGDVGGIALAVGLFGLGVSTPVALWWQGAIVLGARPTLRGVLGAVVTHALLAGTWFGVLSVFWLPLAMVIVAAAAVGPVVAGVVGVVCGLGLWLFLLVGMGGFAAATARYSADLQR
jgi:hypothetical protein